MSSLEVLLTDPLGSVEAKTPVSVEIDSNMSKVFTTLLFGGVRVVIVFSVHRPNSEFGPSVSDIFNTVDVYGRDAVESKLF
jgi:hypothetical protein